MYLDADSHIKFPGQLLVVPVNTDWDLSNVNGEVLFLPTHMYAHTTVAASSRGLANTVANFLRGSDASLTLVDWDKKLTLIFYVARSGSDAEVVARFQLKEVAIEGDLAAKGIGIVIKNLAMYGEAYDTSREEVDFSLAMTATYPYVIRIEHDPGVGDRFYVDNVLKGTSTHEPSGDSGAQAYLVASIINGVAGGTDCGLYISPISVYQDLLGESAYIFHQKE